MRVLAYLRVSTGEQADSGAGIEAQRQAILAEAERRGWSIVEFIEDTGFSGKTTNRPGLRLALDMLTRGDANVLVVSKMDRLSRSLLDFLTIMGEAERQGWALIALDSPADPSTPAGEAMASVMMAFAQLERRLIGQRTREALAVKRAAGVRLGRPPSIDASIARRIRRERKSGRTLREIAQRLNADGVPTARGGRWYASTLQRVLARG